MNEKLERIFHLKEEDRPKTGLAGITIFLTCVYIVAVNPATGRYGYGYEGLVLGQRLSAAIACIWGGWANLPFAMGQTMGLNVFCLLCLQYPGTAMAECPWMLAIPAPRSCL
ncbi:MAG: hypothetical protein ACLUN9_10775 [Enterocloster aldenensis]